MPRAPLARRVSLTVALVAINAGFVLLAVACVLGVTSVVLRRLGDDQALARVELAGAAALDQVRRAEEDLLTTARLLAERPTLAALAGAGRTDAIESFLAAFCATGGIDGCAVSSEERGLTTSAPDLPWAAIAATTPAAASSAPPAADVLGKPILLMVASAPLATGAPVRVIVANRLDGALVQSLGERTRLPVAIVPATSRTDAVHEERELRAQALAAGQATRRVVARGAYRDARVLRSASGAPVAFVETSLPSSSVDRSLAALARRLLLFAALVTLGAVALSAVLGRLLARPLRAMAAVADRIGAGDFDLAVPQAPSAELGTLAATMEHMRGQLRRLTAELEQREAEAQALLGGIVEGVFAVDGDRRIQYLNPQMAQLLGILPGQAIGRFCGDVLRPEGAGGARPCEESCPIVHARSRGSTRAAERLRLADGRVRTTIITSAPPADERQVQVLRDETDVEAARRARDAILANVSHEFKTPLSAQLASIELLRDNLEEADGSEAAARGELVASLERGTLRLAQLVDNLLESVRIEAGWTGMRSAAVELESVVDGAAELTSPLFAQREQRLVVDLPASLPRLMGDAPRLTQVFVNLLANANKFAPSGSVVHVGGEARDGEITLWVEDSGPGLPAGAGDTVFDRFVRAPQQEPAPGGMGLGLWIVKSIVEAHGGRVDARNVAAGGTRFSVTLPVSARPATMASTR